MLDSFDVSAGYKGARPGAVALPPGFLADLAAKFEGDDNIPGLQEVLCPIGAFRGNHVPWICRLW